MNIWHGPVRSGKSHASLVRFIDYVAHDGPKYGEFYLIGKTVHALRRNIITPMEEMLGSECTYRKGDQVIRLWGRIINVVGANDEGSETKIRGSTSAGTYGDELVLWPASFFRMATSRMSVPRSKFFGTTNPDSPQHWLKKEYIDRAKEVNAKCYTWGLRANTFLDADYINQIEAEYTGLWRKRFIDGQWVLAEGAIYDMFRDDAHTFTEQTLTPDEYIVGVDYGTTNPCVFVLIAIAETTDGPVCWAERECYYDSAKKMKQKTDSEYAEDLHTFLCKRTHLNKPIMSVYVDPSAASFKLELNRQGLYPVEDADNDVQNGIRTVARLLHQRRYSLDANLCPMTIAEYLGYVWDPKKSARGVEEPIKLNDHGKDAERYALHSRFGQDSIIYTQQALNW
jgi:PBSX family phage terminase large subunit